MVQNVGRSPVSVGTRIRQGNVIALVAMPYQTGRVAAGHIYVVYDDGSEDDLNFDPAPTTTSGTTFVSITKQAAKDGWIVGGFVGLLAPTGTASISVAGFGQLLILADTNANRTLGCIGSGYTGAFNVIAVGEFADPGFEATWVFQGTVTEDATAGTHVSSLTVTPGAGNEIEVVYGQFIAGNGAANLLTVRIDDGTNVLTELVSPGSSFAANFRFNFPSNYVSTGTQGSGNNPLGPAKLIVSGTCRFLISVSTATVSLTHTFAVVCRIKGGLPTATLADTVGTPTLTTNTSQVFG